jgi:hypothetical protein
MRSVIDEMVKLPNVEAGFLLALIVAALARNLDWRHYVRYWTRKKGALRRVELLRLMFFAGFLGSTAKFLDLLFGSSSSLRLAYLVVDALVFLSVLGILDLIVRWLGSPSRDS